MGLDMELKQNGMEQKMRCSLLGSWKARHRGEKLRDSETCRERGAACWGPHFTVPARASKDIASQWMRGAPPSRAVMAPSLLDGPDRLETAPRDLLVWAGMAVSSEDLHRFIMRFTSYTYLSFFFSRHNTIFTNTAYSFLINSDLSQDSIFLSAWASSHPCVSSRWRCFFQRPVLVFLLPSPANPLLLSFQFQ